MTACLFVRRFYPSKVKKIIEQVVTKILEDQTYDSSNSRVWAETIVANVRDLVKQLNIPSYKIIVQSVVGQVAGQGVRVASKCLWDETNDNYATYTFSNSSLFCTTFVFGIYYE